MEGAKIGNFTLMGIAFDLDGTVIDIESLHHSAHLRAAAEVGVDLSWEDAFERLPHLQGGPDEVVASEIASFADQDVSVRRVLASKHRYFHELLESLNSIKPRDGFREFLKWIRSHSIKVAIGPLSARSVALELLERSDLLLEFGEDLVVAREDVASPKPAPDIYYKTARRMEILPDRQLVFEDSVVGLNSGSAAGCRLVALPTITRTVFLQSLIDAGAEAIFSTWRDPELVEFIRELLRLRVGMSINN